MNAELIKSVVAMVGFYVLRIVPAMDSPESYQAAANMALKTAYDTELPFREYPDCVVVYSPGWFIIGQDSKYYRAISWLPEHGILIQQPLN